MKHTLTKQVMLHNHNIAAFKKPVLLNKRIFYKRAGLAALCALSLPLSGCGKKVDLQPRAGKTMPVTPEGAPKQPTAEELMTPPVQARPERSDEILRRSEQRPTDEFDLPPPGGQ